MPHRLSGFDRFLKGIVIMVAPSLFLESISRHMAVRQYSKRTIDTYLQWIKYSIIFHKMRRPVLTVLTYPPVIQRRAPEY